MTNSFHTSKNILLVLCLPALLIVMLWQSLPVFAIDVSGSITADTIWTAANSPYVLTSDVTIDPGITLTIEPGVEVRGQNDTRLWVQGDLVAVGTSINPITFTSAVNTLPGQWRGVHVVGGTAILEHVIVRYGGQMGSRAINISDVSSGKLVVLDHVIIQDNGNAAMEVMAPIMHQVSFNNVTFTNNTIDRVYIFTSYGSFVDDVTLTPQSGLEGYQITGDNPEISGTVTLTLTEGTTLMLSDDDFLWVNNNGRLVSQGSADKPVLITSAANSGKGQWRGINVSGAMSGGTVSLLHTTIRYSGQGSGAIAIYRVANNGLVELNDVVLDDNGGAGILIAAESMHQAILNNVAFINNTVNRVYIEAFYGTFIEDIELKPQPGLEGYQITSGDLLVSDSVSVTMQSGVTMIMPANSILQINGRLHTAGVVEAHSVINNGLLELFADGEIMAEGSVYNYGKIAHTILSVPSGAGTDFAFIKNQAGTQTKYYGVTITPTVAGDMGITTVSVRGEQPACDTGNSLIHRCFDITPSNMLESTIHFWYLSAELNGNNDQAMNAYHWNGTTWDELIDPDGVLRGGTVNEWLEVDGIDAFSPFGLASSEPTAVQLTSLQVNSDDNLVGSSFIIAFFIFFFTLVLFLFYRQRRHLK